MSKRTKILAKLTTLEKSLTYQRKRVAIHKRGLLLEVKAHWLAITAVLLPAFYLSVKAGKKRGVGQMIKRFMRIGLMAYTSHIKTLLFNF